MDECVFTYIMTTYPDAACRPSPLDPPVTTATLPAREKMESKSRRSVSTLAILPYGARGSAGR